jgi:RNA polymerase sigma-70 factor (ECF subfamily)
MHSPISRSDLVTLLDAADAAALRLWRRVRLPRADLDDLRQDLLVDLIRRLPAFDATRGSIAVFAGLVLRNQASRIAERVARDRRRIGGPLLSLDDRDGADRSLAERLSEADGLAAWHGHCAAVEAIVEARLDLARALGALDQSDRRLCAAACDCRARMLAMQGFGSRATIYRRLRDLRCALAAHGARAA